MLAGQTPKLQDVLRRITDTHSFSGKSPTVAHVSKATFDALYAEVSEWCHQPAGIAGPMATLEIFGCRFEVDPLGMSYDTIRFDD